jgi:hypothetical protein
MNRTVLEFAEEYKIPPAVGGLYVARKGASIAAVIAPPIIRDFGGLRCEPSIPESPRSAEAVAEAVEIASLWTRAKLPGDLFSAIQRRDALLALAHHIAQLIGGANWARAEVEARKGGRQFNHLRDNISRGPQDANLGKVLQQKSADLAVTDMNKRVAALASIASEFRLVASETHEDDVHWLCELALRLASDPGNVEVWAESRLQKGVKELMESATTLARAARFIVLATDHSLELEAAAGPLYEGWRWE